MKVALLTNEFPPDIYGGAGIHVQFLSRELKAFCEIEARAFGHQNDTERNLHALGFSPKLGIVPSDSRISKILNPLDINLQWMGSLEKIDIVHCHTWYSHFGGARQPPSGMSSGPDHPFPRTAPSMESGTARKRRIPNEFLD